VSATKEAESDDQRGKTAGATRHVESLMRVGRTPDLKVGPTRLAAR
jgi:hypothetical protein